MKLIAPVLLIVFVAVIQPILFQERVVAKRPMAVSPASSSDLPIDDEQFAKGIKRIVLAYVRRSPVSSRGNEAVAAMAAIVGERCLEAAAEFPVRTHPFVPGQRIFSDGVNVLLAGDGRTLDLKTIPAGSVYGQIRDQLAGSRFSVDRFPALREVFQGFASRVGNPEDWGKVPLSLPSDKWPRLLPLRVTFETRNDIDAVLHPIKHDKERILRVCTHALTALLDETANQLEPTVTLALVLETINGMAKTAPMVEFIAVPTKAMREAQKEVIKLEH